YSTKPHPQASPELSCSLDYNQSTFSNRSAVAVKTVNDQG
ncbi:unnamed protein product, partial [Ascophyllum nodosum]